MNNDRRPPDRHRRGKGGSDDSSWQGYSAGHDPARNDSDHQRYPAPPPEYGAPPPGYQRPPPGYQRPPPGYRPPPPGYQPRADYRSAPGGHQPPSSGYRQGARRPVPPHRRASTKTIIGRFISGLVALALVAGSGFAWATVGGDPRNTSDAAASAGDVGVATQSTDAQGNVISSQTKGTNILIVGSDSRTDADGKPLSPEELKSVSTTLDGGSVATDTIMILHVPGNGQRATAISIPRDTWINDDVTEAPGVVGPYTDGTEGPYKPNKVNAFYGTAKSYERESLVGQGVSDQAELEKRTSEAGRTMLIKVLQQLTGVKIEHYAEINLLGFYLLSKAVGGVPVCLVDAVKEHRSGADFPAGHFEVEGSDALSFVRQRHGLPRGDLDRIQRQQVFLASAANKILSADTLTSPSKLSALLDAANRSLVLDKGFNLLSFAQQMIGLTSGNMTFTTIPTHGEQPNVGTSALAVNPHEVQQMFAELMSDPGTSSSDVVPTSVDPAEVTVDAQNGTATSGMAAMVGQMITDAGFERGQLSDYPGTTDDNQQAATTVHYPAGFKNAAQQVLDALPVGSLAADDAVPDGHVLVVVGTDMPPPGSAGSTSKSTKDTTAPPKSKSPPSDAINAAEPGCIN